VKTTTFPATEDKLLGDVVPELLDAMISLFRSWQPEDYGGDNLYALSDEGMELEAARMINRARLALEGTDTPRIVVDVLDDALREASIALLTDGKHGHARSRLIRLYASLLHSSTFTAEDGEQDISLGFVDIINHHF
jgi:hypothetical protein